jgi:large subunit ribosomal protein L13
MKTFSAKPLEVEREWWVIDAEGETLGRLASKIAVLLRGKHKPTFTPHVDAGDFVIVINADKIQVTGKKFTDKKYIHHTGYPGGYREFSFRQMLERNPERIIRLAVWGMLPKNRLSRRLITKLKVYTGSEHPHAAQQPVVMGVNN